MDRIDLSFALGLPPEKAIAYFKSKGYEFSYNWYDVWDTAHQRAFTVAGVMKQDILEDIRNALTHALVNGESIHDFKNRLIPLLEQKGWWGKGEIIDSITGEISGRRLNGRRLDTIFRVNMQSAYMAGRYQAQLEAAPLRPYWEYVATMDSRTRPSHAQMNGIILPFDDPFWQYFYPPNGWRCRCRVRTLSQRNINEKGLEVISSDGLIETIDQSINLDGETRQVPAFRNPKTGRLFTADAGFAHNPVFLSTNDWLSKIRA